MVIVGKIMSRLNPQRRWDLEHKVGDPVVIKDIVLEALNKRKKTQRKKSEESQKESKQAACRQSLELEKISKEPG